MKTSELIGPALDWAVAKSLGYEVMLFDQLWRDNAAGKYPESQVEQHLEWQPEKGRQVIVEVRQLQLDQRNPENTTATRCAKNIPNYSTDWSQGGPIIEREGLNINIRHDETCFRYRPGRRWYAQRDCRVYTAYGPTPLIAAMRCYVASKLGDGVDIPKELL